MKSRPAGLTAALALTGTALAGTVGGSAAATAAERPTVQAATTINMEQLLRAAQIDPQCQGEDPTEGAAGSVTSVEAVLQNKGLLDQQYVDGHFGTETVNAYKKYQRSIGYSGLAANGLPGYESLERLGGDHFTITHRVAPGARTTHSGKAVNARTEAMLTEAQRLLDRKLKLDQGSYNRGGDPTSEGTHDGGGVVDINVDGMNKAMWTKIVKTLRTVGFAAWHRTPTQGQWPFHIHAAAINDPDLAPAAQHQTGDYYLGLDGLQDDAPDDGPQVKPIRTWEQYQRSR